MNTSDIALADRNFRALQANPYPGRGLIIGTDSSGNNVVQVYWIMGRSENSRNRIFDSEGGRVFTVPADPSKVKDPSLIIYNAMVESEGTYVVSNGHQTDHVLKSAESAPLADILSAWEYEPDSPNFTPRITGVYEARAFGNPLVEIAILKKSLFCDETDRVYYEYDGGFAWGFGYGVTTYMGDGNPLPSFTGEPILLPLAGNIESVARMYWEALNPENRVSLVVKFIDKGTGESQIKIINKYERVASAPDSQTTS